MTTASAEQVEKSRASTDPKRRGGRVSRDPSYPVLIRLPLVRTEKKEAAEASAASSAAPKEASPPNAASAAIVTALSATLPATLPAMLSATPETAEASVVATPREKPTGPTPSAPRFGSERRTWSRFQGVRLLGQLFVGSLMLGLCIAAYLMIVGGHDMSSTAKNPETTAVDPQAPNDRGPESKVPTRDTAEEQASPPAGERIVSSPTEPPPSARADKEAAAESSPSTGRQAFEVASPPAATPASSQTLWDRDLTADSVQPSPDPSGQDTRVREDTRHSAEFAASGDSRPSASDLQLPLIEPPGTTSSPPQPNHVDPSLAPYPITDPSKFQYPAQYHEILRSRANSRPTTDNSTGPVGRSANAWQPRTARLQPSMDPPPIR